MEGKIPPFVRRSDIDYADDPIDLLRSTRSTFSLMGTLLEEREGVHARFAPLSARAMNCEMNEGEMKQIELSKESRTISLFYLINLEKKEKGHR